jgi:hypothetical protein
MIILPSFLLSIKRHVLVRYIGYILFVFLGQQKSAIVHCTYKDDNAEKVFVVVPPGFTAELQALYQ